MPDPSLLSVVVPTYNEQARITSFIDRMREELTRLGGPWEIVVADDGSQDRTREIVEAISAADPRVRLLALPHRGKGAAVREGLLGARGDWRFMADADLAMPPDNLQRFLEIARAERAPSIIIGSREAPGSKRIGEPWIRHVIGRAFNWIVRMSAVHGISDTQCGYKMFSARAVETICPHLTIDGFAFDVEMLVLARRAGLDVQEVGITWHGGHDSRVAVGRGAAAFLDILRIKWREWRGVYSALPDAASPETLGPFSVRTWAYLAAGIFAAAIAYDLLRMPVQVFDALEEILAAQRSPSVFESFWSAAFNAAYLRPLRIAQIKALFDLADGNYWLAYRGFHALLLVACLFLFTRALRVRTAADLCAAAFALTVLTGLHTFRTTIQEAFPINHFLEIVVLALATLNLAQARRGLLVDIAALLVFAAAALTLESGLLVWVVACSAWLVGLRGISTRGVVLMTVLLAGYFYLRFVSLSVGVPTLVERSSGFMFSILDPPELQQRFGDRLMLLYAYNIAASALSVLFSEPQGGVLVITKSWLAGELPARFALALISSIGTTVLIIAAAAQVIRRYRSSDSSDRLLLVFGAVLAANAVLSFAYVKDDIMSVAGAFYGLGAYAALRYAIGHTKVPLRLGAYALVSAILVIGAAWSVRSFGIHHIAGSFAFKTRNDWASQPGEWKRSGRWPEDPQQQQLILRLRNDALSRRVPNPRFEAPWFNEIWGD